MEPFTSQLESLMKRNKDFSQQLKRRLLHESTNVKNPFNFIVGLFNEGVLSDESNQQDSSSRLTERVIVQLVMIITCSKGADAIGGLVKALEASGNSELSSALLTWVKDDFVVEADGRVTTQKGDVSIAHTGIKMIDSMLSIVKDQLYEQLDGKLVGKASNVVHSSQDFSNLAHQSNFLDEPNIELKTGSRCSLVQQRVLEKNGIQLVRTTGQQLHGIHRIEQFIKRLYTNKIIGSLILTLISIPVIVESRILSDKLNKPLIGLWFVCLIAIVSLGIIKLNLWVGSLIIALWRTIRPAAPINPSSASQSNSSTND